MLYTGGRFLRYGWDLTIIQSKTVLIYLLFILIGIGLIAYGSWSRRSDNMPEPSKAQKYAEREAALIEAGTTGKAIETDSKRAKRTTASRPSRIRST
jgi:phage shock protein PspC (stress-responsive transcriptional regulator)